MTSITMSYDLEEHRNGWRFRFPAGEKGSLWRGPYPTRTIAEEKAIEAINEYVTAQVAASFGI